MSTHNKAYIVETIMGIFAISENNEIIEYVPGPNTLDDIVEYALSIERGDTTSYHNQIISKLKEKGITSIVVEHYNIGKVASAHGLAVEVVQGAKPVLDFKNRLPELAVNYGFASSEEEFSEKLHEILLECTRRKLRKEAQKRDMLAVQSIRAIDDIDRTINLYVARLREWFSLHFPELDELVSDHELYARLVYELGDRSNFTPENLIKLGVDEELVEKIVSAARSSIGAELAEFDMNYIKVLAGIY